jgi:hypothetical protein
MTSAEAILAGWYDGLVYTPGPTVGAFIASDGLRDLLRAPNQVGKSLGGAARADRFSLEHPGSVLGVLVADLDNHYAELSGKIAEVITMPALDPASRFIDGKGWYTNGRRGIRYRNGSRWLFRSGSGSTAGLEGFSADAGWVDEVPQRGHYGAFTRGVHGPLWVTFTPIGRDPRWFRERVEGNPETGAPALEQWQQFVPELSEVECPWLTAEDIAERIAKTDPYERPQRIHAAWEGPTEGRRFTAFTDAAIVSDADVVRLFGRSRPLVVLAADHGEGTGRECWLMIVYDRRHVVILDEYVNDKPTTPAEDVTGVLAMLTRRGAGVGAVDRWVGDVNSAGKANAGSSVNRDFEQAFADALELPACPFRIDKPHKGKGSVEYGERLLNVAFSAGELRVHERCKRTIRSMWHYVGPGVSEDIKHPIDTARYGVQPVLMDRTRDNYARLYTQWAV